MTKLESIQVHVSFIRISEVSLKLFVAINLTSMSPACVPNRINCGKKLYFFHEYYTVSDCSKRLHFQKQSECQIEMFMFHGVERVSLMRANS